MRPAAAVSRSQKQRLQQDTHLLTHKEPDTQTTTTQIAAAVAESGAVPPSAVEICTVRRNNAAAPTCPPTNAAQSWGPKPAHVQDVSAVCKASGAAGAKRSAWDQSGTSASHNKQNQSDILKIIQSPTHTQSFLSPWSKPQIKSPIFQKVCFILEVSSLKSGKNKERNALNSAGALHKFLPLFRLLYTKTLSQNKEKTARASAAARLRCSGPPPGCFRVPLTERSAPQSERSSGTEQSLLPAGGLASSSRQKPLTPPRARHT